MKQKPSAKKTRRTKNGFVEVHTALHERHIEAIDKIMTSRDGIRRGLTKRDVLYQIISQYLNEDREDSMDVVLGQMKLELARENRAIKQRLHALIEMLAVLTRICLGHAPSIPEEEQDVFRARSKERFQQFSDEVVKMLKGRSDFYEAVSSEALSEVFAKLKIVG